MSDVFMIHPLTRVHENAYMIFKVVFVCLKLFYKGLEPTELKCFCVLSTLKHLQKNENLLKLRHDELYNL